MEAKGIQMTQFLFKSTVLHDSRIVDAAKRCELHRDIVFGQLMRLWIGCQDRKRGVLSAREISIVMDAEDKLAIIRALYSSSLLTAPAQMRSKVRKEWLEVWAEVAELEEEKLVIADINYASESAIEIKWDHYLYVNGSYENLDWVAKRSAAASIAGKASAEARRQKRTTVEQISTSVNEPQRPLTTVQRRSTSVNDRSTTFNDVQPRSTSVNEPQRPLTTVQKSKSEIPQSFNQRTFNDVQRPSTDVGNVATISNDAQRFQPISIALSSVSEETEKTESANAPEGARQPSTPLNGVSAGNSQPAERGEDWYASVAHRALKSFQMRGLRFPVELAEDKSCGADDAGELADYVVGTYSFASLISQVARVEITDFQTPQKHTLSKLAKLINSAAPEDWCHGSWRVLGALLNSALIWVQSGQEYYKPVMEKFLHTQAKFKSLARPKADYIGFDFPVDGRFYRKIMFDFVCATIDQIASGEIDQDYLEDCIFGYPTPFPTPICEGFGKDTKVRLMPLPTSTLPAQTESETPTRIAKPELESTEGDQDGSKCQPTSQSILDTNAPLSGPTVTLAACDAVNFTEDQWDDPATDYSYESSEDQEISEMPTLRH